MAKRKNLKRLLCLLIIAAVVITPIMAFCSKCVFHPPQYFADYYDWDTLLVRQTNLNLSPEQQEEKFTNPDFKFVCEFSAGGRDLYVIMTGFFQVCDHIYDQSEGIVVGEFLYSRGALSPKPRGLFLVGDYLYYNYGKDKRINKITPGGEVSYEVRNFKFARINLSTMINERVSRQEYEREFERVRDSFTR